MKKTLTVNLNSIVFNIDDDAYEVLSKYLSDIASHFSSDEEKDDIMADIEARISELFGERLQRNKEVVSIEDVREVIAVMGTPSQFSEDESDAGSKSEKKKKRPRRFYRDPENAVLGGVCGGIAAQFNWDITVVRIALAGLTIFTSFFGGGWFLLLAYFLTWIVAPKAVTASQRLEMQGEEVTVDNIKAEFDNFKTYVESENFKSATRTVGQHLGEIFRWAVKIFLGFLGIVLAFAGFIVVIVLFALLVAAAFSPALLVGLDFGDMPGWLLPLSPEKGVMFVISLLLIAGCPVFLLIYVLIRLISGHKSKSRTTFWVTLVLWLAGVFMLISTTAKTAVDWKNQNGSTWSFQWNNTDNIDQVRDVDTFRAVDVSGNFKIEIDDSPGGLVTVHTTEGFMPKVIVEVRDETLYIHADGTSLNEAVKIKLSADSLAGITARGAVEIKSRSTIKSENLHVSLKGAAKTDLDVDVEKQFKIELSGAAELALRGKCERLELRALGAGEIKAENLTAAHADVYASGASSVRLYASESLNVDAHGAAKIICSGNPKNVIKTDRIGTVVRVQ